MVYSGKPSTGCYLCRRRKIKCDEARPGCRNCEIYGRPCPGYRPPIVLQDKSHVSRKWRSSLVSARESHRRPVSHKDGSDNSGNRRGHNGEGRVINGDSCDNEQDEEYEDKEDGSEWAMVSTPRGLADASMDDRALCFFFDQYTTQRTPDALPGCLESIPLLYVLCRENEVAGSPSSCLRWAVEAAALTSFANQTHDQRLTYQARQRYGFALQGLKDALSTPVEKMQDSTLATILLLVIYEDINGERNNLESSHTAGLELVARLHTHRRLDSKYSRCLFNFAYTQLQIQILGLGAQPKIDLNFLIDLFDLLDPLQSLMVIITKLSQFVLDVPALLIDRSHIQKLTLEELNNALLRAQSLDENLSLWCRNVPDQWLPRVVYSRTGEALITCVSISAATLWNFYRCSRIIVQTIVFDILTHLKRLSDADRTIIQLDTETMMDQQPGSCPLADDTAAHSPSSASTPSMLLQSTPYEIVQNMIVDICRSMPYTLGDVDSSGKPYSSQPHETSPNARIKAIEGYELLWPFWHVMTSRFSTPKQKFQAREALYRLDAMGIKLASKMANAS